jgi:hypothetical protein
VTGRLNICAQVVDDLTIDLDNTATPAALRTEPGVAEVIVRLMGAAERLLERNTMVREVQIIAEIDTAAEGASDV